jgi:hypothetical protein
MKSSSKKARANEVNLLNLNAFANTHSLVVGFNLFKLENVPTVATTSEVDATSEGQKCYERSLRAYRRLRALSGDGCVWDKFFTDYAIGTKNENWVPRLREQLICDAPGMDEAEYAGVDESDILYETPLGAFHPRTIAQLTPFIVNIQSYICKNFAMRTAGKLAVS